VQLSALALVLSAAVVHATWNLLAKRAAAGAAFVWLYAVTASVLWAPLTIPTLLSSWSQLGTGSWVFLVGSGVIHTGYFLILQRGYASADLSLVYPIVRGSGPLLSTLAAVAISVVLGVLFGVRLLREGGAALRLTAACLTVCGVVLLTMRGW